MLTITIVGTVVGNTESYDPFSYAKKQLVTIVDTDFHPIQYTPGFVRGNAMMD